MELKNSSSKVGHMSITFLLSNRYKCFMLGGDQQAQHNDISLLLLELNGQSMV